MSADRWFEKLTAAAPIAALGTYGALQKTSFQQEMEKLAAYSLRKGLKAEAKVIMSALKEVLTNPPTKEHLKAYSRHSALNAGLAARQVRYPLSYPRAGKKESAKRRAVDFINAAAFTAMPPTHHKPGELAQMAKGVGGHRDWFKQGYKPWKYPDPEKVKTAGDDRKKTRREMRKALRRFSREKGLDPNKAMLVAGGAAYLHGFRDDVNDIDFFHPDLKGFVNEQQGKFEMDGGPARDLPPEAKEWQRIGGMKVQTPKAMLSFYQRLNRPKDQAKIKFLSGHLEKKAAEKKMYHGTRTPLKSLRSGSYVTPHKADALSFAVPWSSRDLAYKGPKGGRPPKKLKFKGAPPKDHPIYLYEVTAPTESALTNTGRKYSWNRTTAGPAKLKLVQVVPSWQDHLLEKTAEEGGHWRRLKAGQKGHGRGGELQVGRTWVSKNRMRVGMKALPHQADFSKAVKQQIGGKKGGGIIAAHGTGTGKTFGSINAFEELKGEGKARRALVIAPAGLRQNFLSKGINKFTTSKGVILTKPSQVSPDTEYVVVSYAAFRQNPDAWIKQVNPDMIIADEVHRAGNPEGQTYKALRYARSKVPRFMGLTASISQNNPSDIVPLLDIAQAGGQPIKSKRTFRKHHIKKMPSQQRGIFGGRTFQKKLVDHPRLTKGVGSSVHYVEDLDASSKPIKDAETVEVRMSREQGKKYQLAMKGLDPSLQRKIRLGEVLGGKERANAFTRLLRARQASNSLHLSDSSISLEESATRTPKMKKVLDDVSSHIKDTPDAQVIMYTNYVRGGVDVLSAGLKAKGIPFGVFAGKGNMGITEASRQKAVVDYQAGKNKVILITGAGAEGLSLGNTTMVQLVDGHYNPERMAQAEARGIRAGGLSHRKPENRRVKVKRYVSTLPKTFWQSVTFRKPDKSVGQWVYATAGSKQDLNKELRKVLATRTEHERKKRESRMYRTFRGSP